MNELRNHVQLIGSLGEEVCFQPGSNGDALAQAILITKEVIGKSGQDKVIQTHRHQLVGQGLVAEYMKVLLGKGKEVAIRGRLTNKTFVDSDGNILNSSEVLVTEFMLLH